MTHIFSSTKESLSSVLPIAIIVLILSVTCVSLDAGVLVLFLFGTILLILGMSFLLWVQECLWNLLETA